MDNAEVKVKVVLHGGLSALFLRLCMKLPGAVLRLVEPRVVMPGWTWRGTKHYFLLPYLVMKKHDEQQATQTG
jgi:hypothetical protein